MSRFSTRCLTKNSLGSPASIRCKLKSNHQPQRLWLSRTIASRFLSQTHLNLEEWCRQTLRSRLDPTKKIARSLRQHRELILHSFRAQKLISSGVVQGLNNKAKVTMRKSYGFRTFRVLEMGLYHSLGKLPQPESSHD